MSSDRDATLACTLAILGPLPPGPAPDLQSTSIFDEVLLCAEVEDHLALELAVVAPLHDSLLGGLLAALTVARHDVVVAVESRALPAAATLRRLAEHGAEADVVLLRSTGPRGLTPGRYARACLRPLERALREGRQEPSTVLRGLRLAEVDDEPAVRAPDGSPPV
jgi:molybdopterin-guanine dinucleotide biosynthesis protein A